jgi:hypothetical protein
VDDLLTTHANRVAASHKAHMEAATNARHAADEALREQIAAFGAKLVEASATISDACQKLLSALDRIRGDAASQMGEAFAANLAEIASSSAAMESEMRQREAFLMTGKLPIEDKLPKTAELPQAAE